MKVYYLLANWQLTIQFIAVNCTEISNMLTLRVTITLAALSMVLGGGGLGVSQGFGVYSRSQSIFTHLCNILPFFNIGGLAEDVMFTRARPRN
jgi:hypothetical protein